MKGLAGSLTIWLYDVFKALRLLRLARWVHAVAPFLSLGLAGPFFELWSESLWLWVAWSTVLALWAISSLVLKGERIVLADASSERDKDAVGLLWSLLATIARRRDGHTTPTRFRSEVEHEQAGLLRHLLTTISEERGMPSAELSANWMLYHPSAQGLTTKVRDRPVENRRGVRELSLDHQAGAAVALRDGEIFIETDAHAAGRVEAYGERLPYRSFISVPIFIGETPLGVINVDCTRAGAFTANLEWRIKQVGYIIGLLEVEANAS